MCALDKRKVLMQRWNEYKRLKKLFYLVTCLSTCPPFPSVTLLINNTSFEFNFQKLYTVFWEWLGCLLALYILLPIFFLLYWVVSIPLYHCYIIFLVFFSFVMCYFVPERLLLCELLSDSVLSGLFIFMILSNFACFWLAVSWIIALMN